MAEPCYACGGARVGVIGFVRAHGAGVMVSVCRRHLTPGDWPDHALAALHGLLCLAEYRAMPVRTN